MASFFIRVELFGAEAKEYEKLRDGMSAAGFEKFIAFDDGRVMELPTGCYIGTSPAGSELIRDTVKLISRPLSSREASIIVLRYDDWSAFLYPE